ncbi:MAG: hypothetical protein J6U16_00305 [Ruminococcus sp.]|nr:hypothetical protein [Ruminococcus sp.]
MKTTLKGWTRYQPGCVYAAIMSMVAWLLVLMFFGSYLPELVNGISAVFLVAAVIVVYFLFSLVGKKLHDLTQRFYERFNLTSNHSEMLADFTEIGSMFAGLAVFFAVVAVHEKNR